MVKKPILHISVFLFFFLIIAFCGGLHAGAYAQNQPSPQQEFRYTFVLIHIPLAEALNELIDKTDIDIFYESDLIANKTAYCNIENATAKEALACILEPVSLDFYQQSSGLYVIVVPRLEPPKLGSLTGIVVDENTNEPLPYASIFLQEASTGAASNLEGRFAFSQLKPGDYRVLVSHVAYENKADSFYLDPSKNKKIEIRLTPRTVMSTPIVVNGLHQRLPSEELNAFRISASELQNAPGSSTPSTLQSLNSVAGVHVGDALADVHVQGGDAGEHQYLLDDAPIFVPIRNGGFFGSFSPFAINQITVHKAGFEARHGSFLSGSIELNHDLLSSDGSTATIQIDPLSVNGRINGAIRENKTISAQWMVAGRLGLWGLFQPGQIEQSFREWSQPNTFLSNILDGTEDNADNPMGANYADSSLSMSFSDFHAATRIRVGDAQSIYASLYKGNNEFAIGTVPYDLSLLENEEFERPAESYNWSNQMSQLRYEWVQGDRMFVKVGLWSSIYKLKHPFGESPFLSSRANLDPSLADDFNEMKELGLHAGIDWAPGARHVITSKVEWINTEAEFKLSIDPLSETVAITNQGLKPLRWRLQSFIEDAISLSTKTRLVVGSRFTYIPIQERLYAEPRVSIRHDFAGHAGGAWAVQFAAGLYRQFYNQFDVASYNSIALLPSFRFWIPIDETTRASSAYHTSASLLFLPNEKWQFNLEGYYKHHPYLTVLDYTARLRAPVASSNSRDFLQRASGYAFGLGLSAGYQLKNLQVKASYEYALSRRKIDNRFEDGFIPVPWEIPHKVYAVADYNIINHLTLTLRGQALIGRSWGYRRAYYDYLEPDPSLASLAPYNLSQPNQHKLPAFTQWDLSVAYGRQFGRMGIQGRLNFVNLLDKSNVIDWVLVRNEQGEISRQSRKTTSFFPSLSLRITY